MTPQLPAIAAARACALTLEERLAALPHAPIATASSRARADAAVERWQRILDRDGENRFSRRLRWDGLEEDGIRDALYAPREPGPDEPWTGLLAEACAAAGEGSAAGDPALDPAEPVPFEEVVLPFVQAARRRLRDAAPAAGRVLAPSARAALERALLRELSELAGQALLVDLSVARARAGSAGLSLGAPGTSLYRGFVDSLRAARLEPLVARYPVLARLLAVRAEVWVTTSAELASRADADAGALGELFGVGAPGPITELRTGRGETHCGGRTVAAVRFACGLEVMYKPRSLQLDQAFYGLLEWLRERGLAPDQRVLRVLDGDGYGWVEFVHHGPLESEAELRAYYERAGALLCLASLLGAGDLHAENLIAVGAYPVPVDLETVMGAPVQPPRGDGAGGAPALRRPLASSTLLATGLLPYWQVGAQGHLFSGGGLGGRDERQRLVERAWSFVNTDRMGRERRTRELDPPCNLPRLDERLVPPAERVEDVVRGFERCHAFLEAHRDALTAPEGPLARFRGQRVRVILRDTRVYGSALQRSLHPGTLHDGIERSLQLEILRTSALGSEEPLPYWPAFAAEQRDLEALDYPYFWSFTDGTALHDARDREMGPFCSVSAYDQAVGRLRGLDAADRRHQASLVRFVYAFSQAPAAAGPAAPPAAAGEPAPLAAADALVEGRAIAAALEALAQRQDDGSPQWIGVDRGDGETGDSLRPLSERLYDGRAGVALFLAALDAAGGTGHAALAAEAMLPLRRAVRDPRGRAALAGEMGIGAGLGMGGVVYALTQLGRLTGDAGWLDDARLAAEALSAERIAADGVLEVLGGAAGAALALLALHRATGDRGVLARAEACGRRLLDAAALEAVTGRRAWPVQGGRFGTGFAHGAGGIAAALQALAAATGDGAFAAAAAEGFAFEDAAREPQRVSARHPAAGKEGGASPWKQTWCNGTVGVALGRAAHGAPLSPPHLAGADDPALDATPDHPCCGVLGRAELLLAAGEPARAAVLAARVVARAREKGTYHISRDVPDARYSPGFFQGLSGIGYQLLRVTHPGRLPSVLAFR